MDVGMLWYAGKFTDVVPHLAKAVDYYASKYGVVPTVCHCNPADLDGQPARVGNVRLVAKRNVLRGHLWLGVEQTK